MPQGDDDEREKAKRTHPSCTSRVRYASMAAGGHWERDGCGEVFEVMTPSSSGIPSMSSMSTSDSSMRSKMSGVSFSAVALRSCARLRRTTPIAHADAYGPKSVSYGPCGVEHNYGAESPPSMLRVA